MQILYEEKEKEGAGVFVRQTGEMGGRIDRLGLSEPVFIAHVIEAGRGRGWILME